MIKAVVFDMGGVLLNLDVSRCVNAFKAVGFEDIENYLNIYRQQGFIGDLEEGRINEDQFFEECLKHCNPGTTREDVYHCFVGLLDGLNLSVVEILKQLHGKYALYLLTNNNPLSRRAFDDLMLEHGIKSDELFTRQFYSYELKLQKPGREIFEKAIECIGLPPEEILFVDDAPANCEGAAALGIRTVLYRPEADILAALK